MPIIGISLDAERVVESQYDSAKGTPEATKFTIGSLDSRLNGRLKDMATSLTVDPTNPNDEITTNINANEVAFQTVCFGLRGWENFNDGNGKPIKFKTRKQTMGANSYTIADPDLVRLLPEDVVSELAEHIRKDNNVSEVEAKN
jgi:hypothetical protein